jgi:RNA polymerase sigma-70 factor (ECF subfamily)
MAEPGQELEALLSAHGKEVYGLLLAITRNPSTAEELTQEVFIVALKKGMTAGRGMRLWLREVARRMAMNELRRKRPHLIGGGADLAAISKPGVAPQESLAVFNDELAALRRCLNDLKEDDRRILAERYERSEPLVSIAARCRQSEGYIKQRLFRLRKRLADCVRKRLGGGEVARA